MLTSSVMPVHDSACPHTAACTRALLEHFNWSCLTSLHNWLGSQHFRNYECWWKVSKHDWFHRWQTFWTQYTKTYSPDMTNATVLVVTALKISLSMYGCIFLYIRTFLFTLLVLVTAHQR
jgi:hypothetical protein